MESVPIYQLIASIFTAVASVIVAIVSLRFTYRQNRGWQPLVLLIAHGMEVNASAIMLFFEVWNRRKYPIVIRDISVAFNGVELPKEGEGYEVPFDEGWVVTNSQTAKFFGSEKILDETTKGDYNLSQRFIPRPGATIGTITVNVTYFDPVRGREKLSSATRKFKIAPDKK